MAVSRDAWKTTGFFRGVGIPAPSGQFTVGCVDLMQQMKEGEEDVLVRLFYPTTTPAGQVNTDRYALWYPHKNYVRGYLHFLKSRAIGLQASVLSALLAPRSPAIMSAPLYTKISAQKNACDDTNPASESLSSSNDEDASTEQPTLPVIVFSHGLGAMRTTYSGICCDLASCGYVVASVEHRDLSACTTMRLVPSGSGVEGELVDQWADVYHLAPNEKEFPLRNKQVLQRSSEVSRALDLLALLNDGGEIHDKLGSNFDFSQFKGCMDVSRPAVMGHSFGGATTVQTLSEDIRFKCGVALDVWMLPIHNDLYDKGIEQPLLFINSFDFQWKENVQSIMKLIKPPSESGISTCSMLTIIDSNHFNQSDVELVMPTWYCRVTKMLSRIDPAVAHQVNQNICHSFLKRHQLQDPTYQQPIPNLDRTEGHSEHILFGSNVDLGGDEPTTKSPEIQATLPKQEVSPTALEPDHLDETQEVSSGEGIHQKTTSEDIEVQGSPKEETCEETLAQDNAHDQKTSGACEENQDSCGTEATDQEPSIPENGVMSVTGREDTGVKKDNTE